MAFNFSISLRETARLYLRYMIVGLVGVPLAVLYEWAKRADWNVSIVMGPLLIVGLVIAFFLWRRLGDWQVKPMVAIDFDARWAELLNATLKNRAPVQQRVNSTDEGQNLRLLLSTHAGMLDACLTNVLVAQTLAAQPTETPQPFLGQTSEPTRQRQPAWTLSLGGQVYNAHGLA